jgi:D-alanyl-lipoteichoic acid acyltransferase DltB (MBOAT superfamily)
VDFVFENYTACGSVWMAVSSLFYTMQIYTDFAGYSYIAVGISSLFGLNININFRNPYLAENISDFWRRWHISLSSFLRDYLYIPLGGNRKGTMRKCINISVVFIVCGLWHGGGMSFVIWGALHALYNIADIILRKKNINFIRSGHIGRILTFITVSFAWIFFRAPNTTIALDYIKNMATTVPVFSIFGMVLDSMGMSRTSFYVLLALLLVMAALDIMACRQNTHVPDMFLRMPFTLRCAAVYVMIMLTAIFGTYGPGIEANMIYMHF